MHVGLRATRADADAETYGFVVTWIPWDSGFRGSGLTPGDVITAVDDKLFTPEKNDFEFGQYSEEQYWDKKGAKDGTPTTLTVIRDGKTLEITGKVRADRFYWNEAGKRTVGLDGPQEMASDEFDGPWSFWREDIENVLAGAPGAAYHQNTQQYLQTLESHRPRVEYLAKNFPKSAFARATREDFDRAVERIRGRKYDLTAEDIAYRTLSARRAEMARELAVKSRDELVAKLGAVPIDSLPAVDPLYGDRKSIADKIVTLPQPLEEIAEAGHGWFVAQGSGRSIFLVDSCAPQFIAIYRAMERFKRLVVPDLEASFELIGKVTERPTMAATGRAIYTGIIVQPVAALVDGKMFVDVSSGEPEAKFAGEADAIRPPVVDSHKDMTPTETFASLIKALKLGDPDLWQSFFANWSCGPTGIGNEWLYDPEGGPAPSAHNFDYLHARKMIMSSVYDVRVVSESAPKEVYDKDGSQVELVVLDVDPIGLFDGEYRSFSDVDVHRIWNMQRVNGGPWKFISEQGL